MTPPIAVVTGANQGIGYYIARNLLSRGVQVVMACRDEAKAKQAATKMLQETPTASLMPAVVPLDLCQDDSFSTAVESFRLQFPSATIDVLVNNAAHLAEGDDAIEDPKLRAAAARDTLQINFVNTVAFTEAMKPLLSKSGNSRVVFLSSGLGGLKEIPEGPLRDRIAAVDQLTTEDLLALAQEYLAACNAGVQDAQGWPNAFKPSYCVSKVLLNAYVRVLSRQSEGVTIVATDPGWCRTRMTAAQGTQPPLTAEQGAETPSWATGLWCPFPEAPSADAAVLHGGWFRDLKSKQWDDQIVL